MTTYERLCRILVDDFLIPADDLSATTTLADLGVDSLGVIELLCKVEHDFRIVTSAEPVRLATIEDIVGYIDRLGAWNAPVLISPPPAGNLSARDPARFSGRAAPRAMPLFATGAAKSPSTRNGGANAAPVAQVA